MKIIAALLDLAMRVVLNNFSQWKGGGRGYKSISRSVSSGASDKDKNMLSAESVVQSNLVSSRECLIADLVYAYEQLRLKWLIDWPGLPAVIDGAVYWLLELHSCVNLRSVVVPDVLTSSARVVEAAGYAKHALECEPPYHNRLHVADTVIGMACLLKARRSLLEINDTNLNHAEQLCLLCMLLHDFDHEGLINQKTEEIERLSLLRFSPHRSKSGISIDDWNILRSLILGTDPLRSRSTRLEYAQIQSKLTPHLGIHEMAVLVNEADILASALPFPGNLLTESLVREWMPIYPDSAKNLASTKGRLSFLELHAIFSSPSAAFLGITELVQSQISKLKSDCPRN